MNRRDLVARALSAATLYAISAGSMRSTAVQASQTNSSVAPPDFADLYWEESMYVGMLASWYDMLRSSLATFFGGMEKMSDDTSDVRAHAEIVEGIGVWTHLYSDSNKISPPASFEDSHEHFLDALNSLDKISRTLSIGVIEGDAAALNESVEGLDAADSSLRLFVNSLPYAVPDRTEIGF